METRKAIDARISDIIGYEYDAIEITLMITKAYCTMSRKRSKYKGSAATLLKYIRAAYSATLSDIDDPVITNLFYGEGWNDKQYGATNKEFMFLLEDIVSGRMPINIDECYCDHAERNKQNLLYEVESFRYPQEGVTEFRGVINA